MLSYKLKKPIKLYKNQFEKYILDLFGSNILDRTSMDIDGLLFKIKYMIKNNRDIDKLPYLKNKFVTKALDLQNIFGTFMYNLLTEIIDVPNEFKSDDILEDILAQDVKIDSVYVNFTLIVISSNIEYLKYIDDIIEDDKPFNMFPKEYFRFYTDSYNDGIAKAYPELFENKQQNCVGVGKDSDVFVHNFTFQTTERCSLNCTYCFGKDTMILMKGWRLKKIKDIRVGDMILGIDEHCENNNCEYYSWKNYKPSKVTNVFKHRAECIKATFKYNDISVYITPDHPILLSNGEYVPFIDWWHGKHDSNAPIYMSADKYGSNINKWEIIVDETPVEMEVYNLETECHTFVAWEMVVHNCYQFNKSPMRMEFNTAKKFIDNLLNDKYGYINRYNSPAIIIEFIGGEPLLEINLTRRIYEYFLDKCYELNHPWFTLHRLSICSNGLQYFDDEVQDFFKEYSHNVSFNISIDGNKKLHDSCRIQPNGEGSYDIDMMALNHFNKNYTPERNSKMTLAPSNISYLYDSVVDFIKNGMTCININCVFEEGWNTKTAKIEYYQLKKLADYIIDNDLENLYIAIFNEKQEDVQDKSFDGNSCGGVGSMLALRPNGQFYPCIRYMPTSVGDNVKDLCIGSVDDGIIGREDGSEILDMMDRITRRSQSNDICYECPIGNDCGNCSALGHAIFGTPNKRTTFACIQFIAEALANVYYWNRLLLKHPEYDLNVRKNNVPDEWALLIIDNDELEELKLLELYSITSKIDNGGV